MAVATDMTNGIVDRIRSMPDLLISARRPRRCQPRSQSDRDDRRDLRRARHRLAADRLATQVAATAGMIVLFVLALSWLATGVGLLARNAEVATSFTMVLMFIPYVSTAFVPAHTMPALLSDFARYQPFTPIVETMRGLWMGRTSTGTPVGHEAGIAVIYCVVILLSSFVAASWLFRHRSTA